MVSKSDLNKCERTHIRNYGIDLLKIFGMCGIIGLHIINQGGVYHAAYQQGRMHYVAICFLASFLYLSVDIFAMITGYLMCEHTSVNLKSLINLWGIAYFYIFFVLALFKLFNLTEISGGDEYVYILLPMTRGRYWYLVCYSFIFLFVPYMNRLIQNLSNAEYKKLIISAIVLTSIVPTVGMTDFFRMNNGYSACWLLICYLFGAYIKKYKITMALRYKCIIIAANGLLGTVLTVLIRHFWMDSLVALFDQYSALLFVQYISPLIVINALLMVSIFSELNWVKNKNSFLNRCIQKISKATFGVYVLHIHVLIFDNYMKDAFATIAKYSVLHMCVMVIGGITGIFVICCAIEIVRHEMAAGFIKVYKMSIKRFKKNR